MKDADHSEKAQLTKGLGKSKNEKPMNLKKASGTQPVKSKDSKTVANGTPALNSRAKQVQTIKV